MSEQSEQYSGRLHSQTEVNALLASTQILTLETLLTELSTMSDDTTMADVLHTISDQILKLKEA